MEALRRLISAASGENGVSALLMCSFVTLSFRSHQQQQELDTLEAEKSSLRDSIAAASSAMWSSRQDLFDLASAAQDPSSSSAGRPFIPLSRLRAIYGETEPAAPSSPPSSPIGGADGANESISIA
ncbi:uncharacterized protein LOC122005581 [Zingiber officinale]|uniref:uncharacterized protein LOC122005581 n=1 Tax=Zingiber officinale TaxID=94328 RepID=UPI001C4BADF0|nr:uncharacterized protein LOC122005581 [Zingiber officinale]